MQQKIIKNKKWVNKNYLKPIKIGVLIFNTFNNFFIISFDLKRKKVLSFISSGMVNSLKRYNRKNKYTLELCGRRMALFLFINKFKFIYLVIKSYFRKKFLKSVIKGLLFYKLAITRIYDHRMKAHNGCLKRKARRL